MTDFVVWGVPGSPFTRAVMAGLEEKRMAYRFRAMAPQESKSESYLKMHPFGRVPTLEHGDFVLYETQAILRYLDQLHPEPALTPSAPRAAARMNQIIGINDWYFFPKVAAAIVFQRIVGPVLLGLPTDETAVAAAVPLGRTCIAELDRLLGDNSFLAGDTLSIADLVLAPQLDLFDMTPEGADLLRGTRLLAWLTRMRERPSMIATQPPEALRGAA
jgi:glutathione S-transferase